MKVVYVAGPFRSTHNPNGYNYWQQELNIRAAEELALKVWLTGLAGVICPHANTRFYQGSARDRVWLEGDLAILERCDAVLLAPGWAGSRGTLGEICHARNNGVPIFVELDDLVEWLKVAAGIVDTYTGLSCEVVE